LLYFLKYLSSHNILYLNIYASHCTAQQAFFLLNISKIIPSWITKMVYICSKYIQHIII